MSTQEMFDENENNGKNYIPDEKESEFILKAYGDFADDREIKMEGQPILGGISLQDFWDKCNWDYGVLTEDQDLDDPVTPYSSSISRLFSYVDQQSPIGNTLLVETDKNNYTYIGSKIYSFTTESDKSVRFTVYETSHCMFP